MEFSRGRKRNWECPETADSPEEVRKEYYERQIREILEQRRKKEIEERKRLEREREALERKKRFQEIKEKNQDAPELGVKNALGELHGEKNIESAHTKELEIKQITADELKQLMTGMSRNEARGFIKYCLRLQKERFELTDELLSDWQESYKFTKNLEPYYPELKTAETIIEGFFKKHHEARRTLLAKQAETPSGIHKHVELNKGEVKEKMHYQEQEVRARKAKAEKELEALLVEAENDFEQLKQKDGYETKRLDKEADELVRKIADKSSTISNIENTKIYEANKINELNNLDNLAYLIGALGDGSIYHNEKHYVHRVSYYQKSKEYLEKCIEPKILETFGKKGHFYFDQRHGVYFYEITLKKIYKTMKEAAGPFKDKMQPNLPKWILDGNKEVRRSFIRGFFDAEGCYYIKPNASDYRVRFGQADRFILEGVRNILIHDGFTCSAVLGPYQSKPNVKPYYELHIHGRSQVQRFHELIKPSHPNKRLLVGNKKKEIKS